MVDYQCSEDRATTLTAAVTDVSLGLGMACRAMGRYMNGRMAFRQVDGYFCEKDEADEFEMMSSVAFVGYDVAGVVWPKLQSFRLSRRADLIVPESDSESAFGRTSMSGILVKPLFLPTTVGIAEMNGYTIVCSSVGSAVKAQAVQRNPPHQTPSTASTCRRDVVATSRLLQGIMLIHTTPIGFGFQTPSHRDQPVPSLASACSASFASASPAPASGIVSSF